MCLSNGMIPPIMLESCSSNQKTRQVFECAMKKIFWFWVSGLFVCDIISNVGFWPFMAAGTWPRPNH